jgi:uncharacterized membrane protein YphA (DoxX/SURF4 family)
VTSGRIAEGGELNSEQTAGWPAESRAVTTEGITDRVAGLFRRFGPWLATLARLILAGVLAAAGWLKVLDPDASVRAVRAYRLLPEVLARPVGFGQPVLELALAALLLVGLGTRLVAGITAVLLVLFIVAVASVWARGLSIECGCFGGGGTVAANQTRYLPEILRDTGLLLLALGLVRWPYSRLSLDGWLGVTSPPEEAEQT